MERVCKNCQKRFRPNPRVKNQHYCSKEECQKARRRKWQKNKMSMDEDYRKNQRDCQKRWSQSHPDYWRKYREGHPEYTRRNRDLQKHRNKVLRHKNKSIRASLDRIAKMDVINPQLPIVSGSYVLAPFDGQEVVNMDSIIVELSLLSTGYGSDSLVAKSVLDRKGPKK